MKINIICPECGKILCKRDRDGMVNGIYLYCKKCRKEIYIRKEEPMSRSY